MSTTRKQLMAIVPAAGQGRRMAGGAKLLLPWSDGRCIIQQVLQAWIFAGLDRVVVIVRRDDTELQRPAACAGVDLVCPEFDPPDMRASVDQGLQWLGREAEPAPGDRWLLAPADLPTLSPSVIRQVAEASQCSDAIVAPRFGHRGGHPISLPWSLAGAVAQLPTGCGIDRLLRRHRVEYIDLPEGQRAQDIDTAEDYQRLIGQAALMMDRPDGGF